MFIANSVCSEKVSKSAKVELQKAELFDKIITTIARSALKALKGGCLVEFDALVGDNACKIRAARVANIAEKARLDVIFSQEIEHLEKKELIFNKLKTEISPDLLFLIQAHFLVFIQKKDGSGRTDPALLQEIAPITSRSAKDWIHKTKEEVALASMSFVQEEAKLIQGNRGAILKKMVFAPFIKWHEKRPILPNLYCMEILFTRALNQGRSIVVKIEPLTLFFCPNQERTKFIPKEVKEKDLEQPAIVVMGKKLKTAVKIQDRFLKENLFELLLITASQDAQYLDGREAEEISFENGGNDPMIQEEQKRFHHLNHMAVEKGVSTKNPSFFLIEHIFCDQIGNQF